MANDAATIWRLVGESGVLEQNTAYAYVLMCTHFADTCLVAEDGGEIVGFVVAYRPPTDTECVFVWQVGVADHARGRGIAGQLLDALVAEPGCRGVRYLEATVAPSNEASKALFTGFARRAGVPFEVGAGFGAHLFPGAHDPEHSYRIGPFETHNAS